MKNASGTHVAPVATNAHGAHTAHTAIKFLNLTPHPLNIYNETGSLVLSLDPAPNMRTPRVVQLDRTVGNLGGIPLFKSEFGAISNLPPPQAGVVYIVSRMVRQAVPEERTDIVCPGGALRDDRGSIIGARGLSY